MISELADSVPTASVFSAACFVSSISDVVSLISSTEVDFSVLAFNPVISESIGKVTALVSTALLSASLQPASNSIIRTSKKNMYEEFIVYHFFGEKTSDDISELIPGWLPEGYELTEKDISSDHLSYVFESHNRTSVFMINCDKTHSGSSLNVLDSNNGRQHFTITIGGCVVDCYVSADDVSDYVWHDAEGKFFFSMSSNLPHETNVRIIESLQIVTK